MKTTDYKFRGYNTKYKQWLDHRQCLVALKIKDEDVNVMMCSGNQDTNKKDIYEGDLLQFTLYNGEPNAIREVKYRNAAFFPLLHMYLECKVIGNIIDNQSILDEYNKKGFNDNTDDEPTSEEE